MRAHMRTAQMQCAAGLRAWELHATGQRLGTLDTIARHASHQLTAQVGTMLDVRRYSDYDANDTVSQYLNLPPVKVTCRPSLFRF